MWKQFFVLMDFLCGFVPGADRRAHIRARRLYDWRAKYNALRAAYPDMPFRHVKMIKGGWNIGFIVDKKYVFKIRKVFDKNTRMTKIQREARITAALYQVSPVRIPRIELVTAGPYTFFKYDYMPGRNMNTFSARTIRRYADVWGAQIGAFIHSIHNARPADITDLMTGAGDGWNHNDICNNVIIDPKTMRVAGIIDWEYAGWGPLTTEFKNCVLFSKKIKESGILAVIEKKYAELNKK